MFVVLTTLLGGSCGGYIPFSGAHRLVDAGVEGAGNFRKSVLQGVCTSGVVRILLFLAVLGTCGMAAGNADQIIAASTPAAEAFKLAAGNIGYRLFGLCLFSAGISSVGSSVRNISAGQVRSIVTSSPSRPSRPLVTLP
jgi:Mn2+/Fe2+ NRAMP family transporter